MPFCQEESTQEGRRRQRDGGELQARSYHKFISHLLPDRRIANYLNMSINCNNIASIVDTLAALRSQEDSAPRCRNYFCFTHSSIIDETCRVAMVDWLSIVGSTLGFSQDTVWTSTSLFDRFMASERCPEECFTSKKIYQLAAITCFYLSAKIIEPITIGVDTLCQICRGTYSEDDITSMERSILEALEWRVSCPQPIDFVRHILRMLPDSGSANILEQSVAEFMTVASKDIYFSTQKPSAVGLTCLASALAEHEALLNAAETMKLRRQLSDSVCLDMCSMEILESRRRLSSCMTPSKPSHSISTKYVQTPSSPVSATQVIARQA